MESSGGIKMTYAEKGSQYQLQKYVNEHSTEFNNAVLQASPSLLSFINKELIFEWNSPLKDDGFYEYQDDFLKTAIENEVELSKQEQLLRQYWTRRGPVWDGLAIVVGKDDRKGLILVEAKAHVNETYSQMKATADDSINKIKKTIHETKTAFGSSGSEDVWLKEYYQLANRLSFLYILNEKLNIPTWLVLCNFVDDQTYKPTQLKEWLQHYKEVFNKLGIQSDCALMGKIITVYMQSK